MTLRLKVTGVGKKFCRTYRRSLLYAGYDILGDLGIVPASSTTRRGETWALHDVSFEIHAGEAVGIVGHNGAGKTTLLKLLDGVLEPDVGRVERYGRIVSMIELGIGFNPMLTGHENIVLTAMLHGLSRPAARALIPAVLAFAELEMVAADAIVQTYSVGMRARLAYAIAVRLDPEILLIDEVLAVGDLSFQRKCIAHMRAYVGGGGTVLLVSHALHHLHAICDRAILLDHGRLVIAGDPGVVIDHYLAAEAPVPQPLATTRAGHADLHDLTLTRIGGARAVSGDAAVLRMTFSATQPIEAYCGFTIRSEDGWICITSGFDRQSHMLTNQPLTLRCEIPRLSLVPGRYRVNPMLFETLALQALEIAGAQIHGLSFEVGGDGLGDMFDHSRNQMGQLVTMDMGWSPMETGSGVTSS